MNDDHLHLNWNEERYIRSYTRDTTTMRMLKWTQRAVMWAIFRKLDRAGILVLGRDGLEGLAVTIDFPVDVVTEALPELLKRGVFKLTHKKTVLVSPRFLEAQSAQQSDAARARASRERRRDLAAAASKGLLEDAAPPNTATPRDREVTKRDASVTRNRALSRPVTLNRAVPNHAGPERAAALSPISVDDDLRMPAACAGAFEAVAAKRGPGRLPSVGELWEKFCLVHGGKEYPDDGALVRAWKKFLIDERPVAFASGSSDSHTLEQPPSRGFLSARERSIFDDDPSAPPMSHARERLPLRKAAS